MAADYTPIIQQAAQEWNLDPNLLRALIEQESGYNAQAKSKAGASGLTQLMPDTAKAMGVTDISDPTQQIYGGAKYLSQALDAEGTPDKALLFYHGGPSWRDKYGPESAAYVPAITARYTKLGQAAPAAPAPDGDDPFTAALKAATPADAPTADPFSQALEAAQKTSAKPAPEPSQDQSGAMWNEYGITGDPAKDNAPQGPESTIDVTGALKQGAAGAVAGFRAGYGDAPPGLSAEARAALANGGLINKPGENNPLKTANEYLIVNPLSEGARVMGGLLGAYQGGVAGSAEGTGNQTMQRFGRDLAALPEAFPTGDFAGGTALPRGPVGEPAPANPLQASAQAIFDQRDAAIAARTPTLPPANPLAATVNAPSFVPPGARIPDALRTLTDAPARPDFIPPDLARPNALAVSAPTTVPNALAEPPRSAEPAPQSAGSAASRDLSPPSAIEMTPAQVQAYRSTAEGQKLLEPQQPGIADPNVYVPGVTPNQAEIEQSVNTARELKSINAQAPEVSQEAKEVAAANSEARQQYFAGIAGSDVDVANAKAARAAQADKDLSATWANKKSADPQAILDLADDLKASPDGRRPLVRNVIDSVTKELHDSDGNLITDPEQLYGVRKHIDDLMSREAAAGDPKNVRAQAQLVQIKAALDKTIEAAAPGFRQYLDNFRKASTPIDEMQALQTFEPKLYDVQNRMTYNKVQTMMRQLVDSRQAPGINPFQSISDDTMQKLWNLRDDLRRSASAQELARAPGSDTAQNMIDVLKGVGKSGANLATHGILATHFGPVANVLYHGAKNVLSAGAEARAAKKQTARGLQILHPDPSQLRNPLQADQ